MGLASPNTYMHILNHTQGVKLVKMQVPHKKKSLYIVNLSLLGQLTINLSTCFSHSILLYMYYSLVAKKKANLWWRRVAWLWGKKLKANKIEKNLETSN